LIFEYHGTGFWTTKTEPREMFCDGAGFSACPVSSKAARFKAMNHYLCGACVQKDGVLFSEGFTPKAVVSLLLKL